VIREVSCVPGIGRRSGHLICRDNREARKVLFSHSQRTVLGMTRGMVGLNVMMASPRRLPKLCADRVV